MLLPKGYDDPKNAGVRYPMEVIHGHYPKSNPNRFDEKLGNDFSKWWMSDEAPRFISVVLRTENPFYDDSYVIDSANIGPYGTAFHTELLPAIDKQFRTIGQPWARVMTGGSTGGWVSLARTSWKTSPGRRPAGGRPSSPARSHRRSRATRRRCPR